MLYWIFMFVSVLLIPGIMMGLGRWLQTHPPKTINCLYGYRTTMSMKNQDTWDFAQKKSGQVWTKWGPWVLVPSVLGMLPVLGANTETVSLVGGGIVMVQLIPLLASIYPVERALGTTFDKEGNRR